MQERARIRERAHIVVVEDDPLMARALRRHLERDGYAVTVVATGAELRRVNRSEGADLVLLDLSLGTEDGVDIIRDLVRTTSAAVIVVTGRDSVQDRITGLDSGADDYVVKPFAPAELLARVRAVLRRHLSGFPRDEQLAVGPFMLDTSALTLRREGLADSVHLTETETRILQSLMHHFGRAVTRQQLMGRERLSPDDRTVAVHIANVRRKLKQVGMTDLIIGPVRGCGYRLWLDFARGITPSESGSDVRP